MSTQAVTIAPDGTISTTSPASAAPPTNGEDMPPMAAFIIGLMLGALILWSIQRWTARKVKVALRESPRGLDPAPEMTHLKGRVETLESILTDPAERTRREIELLR